jgi:hypothetical protein
MNAKAGKSAMQAEQQAKLEAQREEAALKKLEEELRKEDEIKAAKLKPKPVSSHAIRPLRVIMWVYC